MILKFFTSIASYAILDFFWLGFVMKSFYIKTLGPLANLTADKSSFLINKPAGAITYIIMALGLIAFPVARAQSLTQAALYGALYGLVIYGVYDFTNMTTLRGWTWQLSMTDLFWGIVASAITTAVVWSLR